MGPGAVKARVVRWELTRSGRWDCNGLRHRFQVPLAESAENDHVSQVGLRLHSLVVVHEPEPEPRVEAVGNDQISQVGLRLTPSSMWVRSNTLKSPGGK